MTYASFSPDGSRAVTSSHDKTAQLWDVSTFKPLSAPMYHDDSVAAAVFSPDGLIIATAGLDGTVRLWDGHTGQSLTRNYVLHHSSRVEHLAFSPDGRKLVTGCLDGTIRVWDLAERRPDVEQFGGVVSDDGMTTAESTNNSLVIQSRDGERTRFDIGGFDPLLVSPSGGLALVKEKLRDELKIVDTASSRKIGLPPGASSTNVFLSNHAFAAIVNGGTVQLFNVATGEITPVEKSKTAISAIQFDPAERRLAIAANQILTIWDIHSKAILASANLPTAVSFLEFSADNRLLLVGTSDPTYHECAAFLLDPDTCRKITPPLQHRDGVRCGAFSSSGDKAITGGEDTMAIVWDTHTGKLLVRIPHHDQGHAVCFDHDGKLVATWTRANKLRIFTAIDGQPLTVPMDQAGPISSLSVMQKLDQVSVACINQEHCAYIWSLGFNRRGTDELQTIAHILCNDWPFGTEGKQAKIRESWQIVTKTQPEMFKVSPSQAHTWESTQAQAAAQSHDSWAIKFHGSHEPPSPLASRR